MKTSKAFLAFLLIIASLAFFACDNGSGGDDDDEEVVFLDQTLQGTINGKTYTFVSGTAEDSYFEDGSYDFELYNIESTGTDVFGDPDYPFSGYLMVMATVPAEIGRTDLYFDTSTGENKTVTLYDPDADSLNIIAHIGAVEITEIDTDAGTITGRMVASDGDGNEVNGNFTVPILP